MIGDKFKSFFMSLGILSTIFLSSNALAEQRNVISSCSLHTTAGDSRGKCIIKTHIDGDYIMIQVIPQGLFNMEDNGLLRVSNNPSCTIWTGFNEDGCKGEVWDGTDWTYAVINASEGRFGYGSGGSGFAFYYDGPLPRPFNLSEGTSKIKHSLLIGQWSSPGKCNSERQIYTSNGEYFFRKRLSGKWKTTFKGIYIVKDEVIRLLLNGAMEYDDFNIKYLDTKTLKLESIPDAENDQDNNKFTFLKCSS